MLSSRDKLLIAVNLNVNWLDIVNAGKSDWYRKESYELSPAHIALRQGYLDIVEYVTNTYKKDDNGKLGYHYVYDDLVSGHFQFKKNEQEIRRMLLIARQILINNPDIASEKVKHKKNEINEEPMMYLNSQTRPHMRPLVTRRSPSNVLTRDEIWQKMDAAIKLGAFLLQVQDGLLHDKGLKDMMPFIMRYTLLHVIYNLHVDVPLLFNSNPIRQGDKYIPLITHSDIDTIISPYLNSRKEYTQNARKLVKAQGGGFFGCFGKSSETTIFVKRLQSMLEANSKDIKSYIHDFVKNRYLNGNFSEENIIPALIEHQLITKQQLNDIKEEVLKPMLDDWEELANPSGLSGN